MKNYDKYKPPVDKDGNPYWVPVVVKNRDVLIAFLNGMRSIMQVFDIPAKDIDLMLGSERFNDITVTGKRLSEMSKQEAHRTIANMMSQSKDGTNQHQENGRDILSNYFLGIDCTCGNFYGFNNELEIPEERFSCGLCDKVLIDYTGKNDMEFVFDGKSDNDKEEIIQVEEETEDEDEVEFLNDQITEINARIDEIKKELDTQKLSKRKLNQLIDEAEKLESELVVLEEMLEEAQSKEKIDDKTDKK